MPKVFRLSFPQNNSVAIQTHIFRWFPTVTRLVPKESTLLLFQHRLKVTTQLRKYSPPLSFLDPSSTSSSVFPIFTTLSRTERVAIYGLPNPMTHRATSKLPVTISWRSTKRLLERNWTLILRRQTMRKITEVLEKI
jgi:hypothetical protein